MKKALIIIGAAIILFGCKSGRRISVPSDLTNTIPLGYERVLPDPPYHPVEKRIIYSVTPNLPLDTIPIPQELKIGDKVPPISFTSIDGSKFNLYDDTVGGKTRMVILDFWATWCGSCIAGFPKADSLQKRDQSIKYILVDSREADGMDSGLIIEKWGKIKAKQGLRNLHHVAILDTVAEKYFPHTVIPHYVFLRFEEHEFTKYFYVVGFGTFLYFEDSAKHAWKREKK